MTDQQENMRIWDELCKTDPQQTKPFKRAGGFSGTALKPMWVWKRLTEKFGPVGHGWGFKPPVHQVVQGSNQEVMVYTTVEAWYLDGEKRCEVSGVGGDKVVSYIKASEQYNRPERWENDDEAFKKSFTDALMNAFKFVGAGADIHMGMFDDSKYLREVTQEFAKEAAKPKATKETTSPDHVPSEAFKLAKAQLELKKTTDELGAWWNEQKATFKTLMSEQDYAVLIRAVTQRRDDLTATQKEPVNA